MTSNPLHTEKHFLTNALIRWPFTACLLILFLLSGCSSSPQTIDKTAAEILGNPAYQAISFGGYREVSRDIQPDIEDLKEDLRILSAMDIKLLRTYNVYLDEAANLLEAIRQLKEEDADFEMYVMLGAWMECLNAFSDLPPDHSRESPENEFEIARAIALAKKYPESVKIIAVGNEAMVHWAESYYVQAEFILKWVKYLQDLKKEGELPETLWITSSDNFASWGGGDTSYHGPALNELIQRVDFISMHTYPMHDTHYNPEFWGVRTDEAALPEMEKIERAMQRARDYAIGQYASVVNYMHSLGIDKPVHIGETGWASISDGFYGDTGSRAVDEYKAALYYWKTRAWTSEAGITCFYFEAFDEQWKDSANPMGSENHFGLINLQSEAKYVLWDLVDAGIFEGLTRDGLPITKTFEGKKEALMKTVLPPPAHSEINLED